MGFITDVVIQLALFLVFSINCENTTGIGHPLNPVLNVTTECITYRYVLCPKNMTAMTVIFEYEKMDEPYSFKSNDSQCISYRFIPCQDEPSPDLILEQERHRQTKSINENELKNFEKNKNLELSVLKNKLNCLTSQITQCEISQIISKENMKQLNVTENEKFVLQRDINNLTDRIKQCETSRQRSDENLILCKKLAYDLTVLNADCEEMKKTGENPKPQEDKKQLGQIYQEIINNEIKRIYTSIAKAFDTPFSGELGVQSYTLYQMGRMSIIPKPNIQPLVPQYDIVFNDVTLISYNLEIQPCKQSADSSSVFIAVVSAPKNLQYRENIRATWKNHVDLVKKNGVLDTIEFAFVLGPTDDKPTQNSVIEESKEYKDIIQISKMPEEFPSHMTMPGVLKWIDYRCPHTEFLFKVEDDMYVNVHKLAYFVRDFKKFGNNGTLAIYSQMVNESIDGQQNQPKPKRSGEKMVSLDDWPWNTYPNYFDGPAYLMHKSTIFPLLAAIQTTPVYSFVEEVYITGICGDKVGLNRKISGKSLPVMWPRASENVTNTCDVHKFLSWKNTETISHPEIDAFYSGRAPNLPCDYNYKDSHNFTFFRLD